MQQFLNFVVFIYLFTYLFNIFNDAVNVANIL